MYATCHSKAGVTVEYHVQDSKACSIRANSQHFCFKAEITLVQTLSSLSTVPCHVIVACPQPEIKHDIGGHS